MREVTGELETFINEGLAQFGIPGAAVAIVQNGEVVYSQGFGVTEQGGDTPITPQTQMMIGSTGKSLTTMLMGTLVDEGKMNWDTPVIDMLPEFAVSDPELTQSITLRNLVCACTGVPRRDFELFFNANDLSAEAIVQSLATFEFFTEFGEAFQYSNQLVATGGYAAAAAAGADFGDLFDGYRQSLQNNVLTPIGMANTTLSFEEVRARDNYAMPHSLGLDGAYAPLPLHFEEILTPVAPAGAHWSTLKDMTRYLLTELAVGVAPDGTRVVSEENLRETWQPQVPVNADTDYGLGWLISDYKGLQLINHGGNTLGFTSSFGFLPEVDLGIIVLSNSQGANYFTESVRARLLELLLDQAPEAAATMQFAYEQMQRQLEDLAHIRDAVDPAAVEPYLGTYHNAALGTLEVRMDDGALIADAGEFTVPLLPFEEEDNPETLAGYLATEAPIAGLLFELDKSDAGVPVVKFGQGAVAYTFERVD
ncbi:MAG: serine hydrolase [Caldilineaceae bacterium]